MKNLKLVEKNHSMAELELAAAEFDTVDDVIRMKRNLSSQKTNWSKKVRHPEYEQKMTEILAQYHLLCQVQKFMTNDFKKPVTQYDQADVDQLTYDETVKALKSIQSKKALTRWNPDQQSEYDRACDIEKMLQAHRENVKPLTDSVVHKSDIQNLVDLIDSDNSVSIETIRERLAALL